MTTPAPKRREQRRTHLDASVVPVERALLARADTLEQAIRDEMGGGAAVNMIRVTAADIVADEFRMLAEALHWW